MSNYQQRQSDLNLVSQLSYTDPQTGLRWKQEMKASYVVPIGYHGLPGAKADFQFMPIVNPAARGIPEHPLKSLYPNIQVLHFAMIIDFDRMAEELNGKRGIAFWLNNNGSDFCASVTSEFGRTNLGPIGWRGWTDEESQLPEFRNEDPMKNARAKAFIEWRTVVQNGRPWIWCNGRQHGFPGLSGEHAYHDWLDGCPESVENMYDPERAVVRQTIVTPPQLKLGTAQQMLSPDSYVSTYSIMLTFPNSSKLKVVKKLQQFQSLLTLEEAQQSRGGQLRSSESTRSYHPEAMLEKAPAAEITHGNQIRQHVIMPINDPTLWQPTPSAVIVCWPISINDLTEYNRPAEARQGQVGFTF